MMFVVRDLVALDRMLPPWPGDLPPRRPGATHVFMAAERLGRHVRVRSVLAGTADGTLLLPLAMGELLGETAPAADPVPIRPPTPDPLDLFLAALPE